MTFKTYYSRPDRLLGVVVVVILAAHASLTRVPLAFGVGTVDGSAVIKAGTPSTPKGTCDEAATETGGREAPRTPALICRGDEAPGSTVPAIETDTLRKAYGDVTALDGLSLSVAEGELFGLLGPNGAGKTTTMEMLTGQARPDSGTARVLGVDPVAEPTAAREGVGILPEKESPPSFMTPREYFQFVGAVRGLEERRVDERVETWADRLDVAGKLDTLSTDLSRGQQQKVMVAAAFLHEPALVFIDEPLANLDPIAQEGVKRFLSGYREAGNTVILSTHDVSVAAELCTRVGVMHAGDLIREVRPADLGDGRSLLDVFMDAVEVGAEEVAVAEGGPDGAGVERTGDATHD